MTDAEYNEMLDSLFPIGKERWVKVRYLNRDKALQAFRTSSDTSMHAEELGYEVTAIGIRDEHVPQISALMDARNDVLTSCAHAVSESVLNTINEIFRQHMDRLKERTIQTVN